VSPIDEPTFGELLRDVQSDVRAIRDAQTSYLTKEMYDVREKALERRVTALEESRQTWVRLIVSAFALPLLVVLAAVALGVRP
jgi:anti-sigma factor RsiW